MSLEISLHNMTDWIDGYRATGDLNERYEILRREITELRGEAEGNEFYDEEEVAETASRLNGRLEGELIAFVANDFGFPRAFRPEGVPRERQQEVRRAILERKYDDEQRDLDELRQELLEVHQEVHKAIIAEVRDGDVRYHLPEGSNRTTNFITVREMVGLVDWTTNSYQSDEMSVTY